MPKSKRDKKISLTKTSKKGVELKKHILEDVRACAEKYKTIVLFSTENMRNNKLKDLRGEWKGSRFFFGKNKIVAIAFGKTPESECVDGISKMSSKITGQRGLLFTNESKEKVLEWMDEYAEIEYARSGFVATETVVLPEGPLEMFIHSMEPQLRLLGMPTALKRGVVTLLQDYTVCKEGQVLNPEQARILKLIGKPLATFKLSPIGVFTKENGYEQVAKESKESNKSKENVEMDE
ncbi:hypothetical protein TKK_0004785 [Trichogramma kaykai]|uniref:Ribosome assembly factor mrt4 n=1 Tax=Trichogramma kaykai TaxID=54128 RepID=A0ABD2XKH9_9HYME